jgi:hypothetical protein
MPVLDRQPTREPVAPTVRAQAAGSSVPRPSLKDMPPRSVPETAPTPLQRQYINLSVIALICGAVAITALEIGVSPGSILVKACVIVGAPLLAATTADATLRIWRSAWAWMPVDRGKGLFRLAWVAATVILLAVLGFVTIAVLRA